MAWVTRLYLLMVDLDVAGAPHHQTAVDIHHRLNLDVDVDPHLLLGAGGGPIITHGRILISMILAFPTTSKVVRLQVPAAEVAEVQIRIGAARMVAELSCRRFCGHSMMRMGSSNLSPVQLLRED